MIPRFRLGDRVTARGTHCKGTIVRFLVGAVRVQWDEFTTPHVELYADLEVAS